jgi:hypothetical protein
MRVDEFALLRGACRLLPDGVDIRIMRQVRTPWRGDAPGLK